MSYVTYSNVILVVWCLFITEEFQSTAWVSTTIKIATGHIVSFAPIFIGIVVAAAVLLVARFGNYFWQFRSVYDAVLSVFGWAITSPITKIDSGVDELIDDEARYLAINLILLTCFVAIFAANIFISIVMDSFAQSKNDEAYRWKGLKPSYYTLVSNENTLAKWSWFSSIFPKCEKQTDDLSKVLD